MNEFSVGYPATSVGVAKPRPNEMKAQALEPCAVSNKEGRTRIAGRPSSLSALSDAQHLKGHARGEYRRQNTACWLDHTTSTPIFAKQGCVVVHRRLTD